jgi:hypothetical protein
MEFARGRGSSIKVYSVEEALAKSDEAEKAGLIHEGPGNTAVMPFIICSCSADCWGMLIHSQASGDNMHAMYTPAGLRLVLNKPSLVLLGEIL